jgi:single-strand DNA-binding protein
MINKAILVGYVGQDPDIRAVNGKDMASFSLATSEKWTDKNSGEKKEKTEWHRVVCFYEGLVGVIKKYIKKGSKVYVEGAIVSRTWDDNGTEKRAYEIHVKIGGKIILLDKRGGEEAPPDSAYEDNGRP